MTNQMDKKKVHVKIKTGVWSLRTTELFGKNTNDLNESFTIVQHN